MLNASQHVRGSAALVKLRGEEQLRTQQGRRLFVQASIGILTSCVQLTIRVPKQVEDLINKIPQYLDTTDEFITISFGIHRTMIDVNQYRVAVRKGKITDLHQIISKALELDARLEAVADHPPPEFQYYYEGLVRPVMFYFVWESLLGFGAVFGV
jgi:hypothetical protein